MFQKKLSLLLLFTLLVILLMLNAGQIGAARPTDSLSAVNDEVALNAGYIGDIGTATIKSTADSLDLVTTANVAAGNDIIIGYATDPSQNLELEVTDSVGNTYEEVALAVNWANGRTYIFAAFNVIALPSGSTISITYVSSDTTAPEARAAVASVFQGLAEVNVVDQALGNPMIDEETTASGTTPSVGPTGTTTQANELVVGVIGTIGPVEDAAGTWANSFVNGQRAGTTGGDAASNQTVSMGYLTNAAIGQYTAQKSGITSRNWSATIATFKTENSLSAEEYSIVLGRPTDESVNVNAIFDQAGQVYFEYGTAPGSYTGGQTATMAVTAGNPIDVVIDGLAANTKYYYRAQFQPSGSSTWVVGGEYSFHTQRAPGQTFTFTIISDSHLGQTFSGNTPERYEQTTLNVAGDAPDFHLDLGDAFITSLADDQDGINQLYLDQRPFFGNFSHSAPVFLVTGNHENEEGWNLDDTPFSRALANLTARKEYFPNPVPDSFYSGNSDPLPAIGGDQLREDYYAFTWGNALFVVLDPFQYTMDKPYGTVTGSGEETDDPQTGDQWSWTLGQDQYDWFKETLEGSNAAYKFVFSHHVTGGQLEVSGAAGAPGYVRGGGLAVPYFEWGGNNANDTWGFNTERPGWGDESIHQLMVDNNVSAYFHGHDHQFVHEERDGIVYQLAPAAGMDGYGFDLYDASPYVVSGGNLPSAGHLRITVAPDETTVEYVRSAVSGDTGVTNGSVDHAYTIAPNAVADRITGDANRDGLVNSTDALIILSHDAGISIPYTIDACSDVNSDSLVNSTDALIILSHDAGISVQFEIGGVCNLP